MSSWKPLIGRSLQAFALDTEVCVMLHVRRTVSDGDCAVSFRVVRVSKSVFFTYTVVRVYIRLFFFYLHRSSSYHISKLSLVVCEPMTGIIFTDSFHPLKVTFVQQQLHESPV